MSIPPTEPVKHFVRAGAGAGKTWNLTRQVIARAQAFYEKEGCWPKTVVTTFTRKATQELKERLLTYCLKEKPEALEYVQSSSHLYITTMHGLFDTFLRRYGSVLGLPNQFMIIDPGEALKLRKRVLKKILTPPSELSVVLGRYDFRRILEVLQRQEDLSEEDSSSVPKAQDLEVYALELASLWAEEFRAFIEEASDHVDGEKWSAYFSYLNDIAALLESQNWDDLREGLGRSLGREKKPRKSKNNPGLPEFLDKKHKALVGHLKKIMDSEEFDSQLWGKSEGEFQLFKKLSQRYRSELVREKLREGKLELNDLENFSRALMSQSPQASESFYQDWDDWFIDEFQDTSPKQLKLLDSIVRDKPCYIVGDPQQSIYLFRGARSEVFFDKEREMTEAGSHIQFLSTNYRSDKPLMDFFNGLFTRLGPQFSPMEANDNSESSEVVAQLSVALDEESELALLSQQISDLLDKGVSPKDISVLTRTNGQLEKVLSYLRNLKFPVISHASSSYFSRREILDAMSVLKFLLNPWDDTNLVSLLRSPWVPLEDTQIVQILGGEGESSWKKILHFFQENPEFEVGQWLLSALKAKSEMGVAWVFRKTLISLGFFDYSQQIDSTGRREANLWKLINLVEKNSREPGAALLEIVEKGGRSLDSESVGDNTDASSSMEPNKVNLMTIHSSKGLQFEYVFLPFMHKRPQKTTHFNFCQDEKKKLWAFRTPVGENGKFIGSPLEKVVLREISQREDQELLRVFYVALTRAEKKVFMSWYHKVESNSLAEYVTQAMDLSSGEHREKGYIYKVDEVENIEGRLHQPDISTLPVRPARESSRKRFYLESEKHSKSVTGGFSLDEKLTAKGFWEQQQRRWQGVVLHRLFEMLKYGDPQEARAMVNRWLGERQESSLKALDYIINLKEPLLLDIIQSGEVEWFFQAEMKGRLVEGRIDLWGFIGEELWVVDYKTGSSRQPEKAFAQLEVYKEALWKHLGATPKTRLCLIYPFEEKVLERT